MTAIGRNGFQDSFSRTVKKQPGSSNVVWLGRSVGRNKAASEARR